jgi:hypothetical protein
MVLIYSVDHLHSSQLRKTKARPEHFVNGSFEAFTEVMFQIEAFWFVTPSCVVSYCVAVG